MKNIKTQQLRYLAAVYDEGSITAAAHRVNATQSGVSMRIREFEEWLGVSFFERTPTGVVPTKIGDIVYQRATRILREIDELEQDVLSARGQIGGRVRAGIMPTFSRSILAPTLIEFGERHPFVDVQISEGYSEMLTHRVSNGELDFAVVPAGSIPDGLRSVHVETDLEILVESTREDGKEPARTNLATAEPLNLVLPGPANARRKGIDQYLENICQSQHSVFEIDSMMTTFDLLDKGHFASILPGCLCISKFDDPCLRLSPISKPELKVDYLLIEPASKGTSTVVKAFSDTLCRVIRLSCVEVRKRFSDG